MQWNRVSGGVCVVEFVRRGTARVGVSGERSCAWWDVRLVGLCAVGYYDGVGYD